MLEVVPPGSNTEVADHEEQELLESHVARWDMGAVKLAAQGSRAGGEVEVGFGLACTGVPVKSEDLPILIRMDLIPVTRDERRPCGLVIDEANVFFQVETELLVSNRANPDTAFTSDTCSARVPLANGVKPDDSLANGGHCELERSKFCCSFRGEYAGRQSSDAGPGRAQEPDGHGITVFVRTGVLPSLPPPLELFSRNAQEPPGTGVIHRPGFFWREFDRLWKLRLPSWKSSACCCGSGLSYGHSSPILSHRTTTKCRRGSGLTSAE